MNLTHAQKHNKRMDEIFDPELKRLKLCEDVAKEILAELDKAVDIDPCGLVSYEIRDLVSGIIRKNYFNFKD